MTFAIRSLQSLVQKNYKFLVTVITESEYLGEDEKPTENYMFFANLKTIKNAIDDMLKMNEAELDKRIADGHDWASDHMAVAKDNIEQVYHWVTSRKD